MSYEEFRKSKKYLKINKVNDDQSSQIQLSAHKDNSNTTDYEKDSDYDESNEHTCSICLNDYEKETEVILLPCKNHLFHAACI